MCSLVSWLTPNLSFDLSIEINAILIESLHSEQGVQKTNTGQQIVIARLIKNLKITGLNMANEQRII